MISGSRKTLMQQMTPNIVVFHISRGNRNLSFLLLFVAALFLSFVMAYLLPFRRQNCLYLIIYAVLSAVVILFLFRAIKYWIAPQKSNAFLSLSRFGMPNEVARDIDKEFCSRNLRIAEAYFTNKWFLQISLYGIDIYSLVSIVWAHAKETKKRINGIPAGSDWSVVIYIMGKKAEVTIPCCEEEMDALMAHIKRNLPWVTTGYSKELSQLWSFNKEAFFRRVATQTEKR